MKIAHISDIHICTENKKRNIKKFRTLLTHLTEQNFDHIVITGDLSHNASQKDFKVIRNILQDFGLLDPLKLSLVIGNHDIYGGIYYAEDIISFPGSCKKVDYDKRIKIFGKYFSEAFEKTYFPLGKYFPYAKELGDLVIIGINSNDRYSKLKNPFASNGKTSRKELSGLKDIFTMSDYKDKKKIVLIHHHFNKLEHENSGRPIWGLIEAQTMKLRRKKKLISLFEDNKVSIVLHGHVHTISDYQKGNVKFINAGASIEGGDTKFLKYNKIDINNGIITTTAHSIPDGKSKIYFLNRKMYSNSLLTI